MATSNLTAARLRELFDCDAVNGVLIRKSACRKAKPGPVAGTPDTWGYLRVRVDGAYYPIHRLIWLHVHGEWPKHTVDHVNGQKQDNRIANLRDVLHLVNSENMRKPRPSNQAGLLGVSPVDKCPGRWRARIKCKGEIVNLGNFDSAEAAHAAYVEAKRKLHQGCTL